MDSDFESSPCRVFHNPDGGFIDDAAECCDSSIDQPVLRLTTGMFIFIDMYAFYVNKQVGGQGVYVYGERLGNEGREIWYKKFITKFIGTVFFLWGAGWL